MSKLTGQPGSSPLLNLMLNFIFCFRFLEQARPILVRIRGVRLLWSEVEQLRAESYCQDNKEHEDMLLEVTMNSKECP